MSSVLVVLANLAAVRAFVFGEFGLFLVVPVCDVRVSADLCFGHVFSPAFVPLLQRSQTTRETLFSLFCLSRQGSVEIAPSFVSFARRGGLAQTCRRLDKCVRGPLCRRAGVVFPSVGASWPVSLRSVGVSGI